MSPLEGFLHIHQSCSAFSATMLNLVFQICQLVSFCDSCKAHQSWSFKQRPPSCAGGWDCPASLPHWQQSVREAGHWGEDEQGQGIMFKTGSNEVCTVWVCLAQIMLIHPQDHVHLAHHWSSSSSRIVAELWQHHQRQPLQDLGCPCQQLAVVSSSASSLFRATEDHAPAAYITSILSSQDLKESVLGMTGD